MPRPDLPDDPRERARAKADLHVRAARRPAFDVDDGQRWRVQVRSEPYRDSGGALVFDDVRVTVDGEDVDVGASLPWRFVSPPLLVPDPDGDIEDDVGRRLSYDRRAALARMLIDTAKRVVG